MAALVDVAWKSCSVLAVGPTMTSLPRTAAASKRPLSTSAKLSCGIVPPDPAKSIQALPPAGLGSSCPAIFSAAVSAKPGRKETS
jgi:hypothetical protein